MSLFRLIRSSLPLKSTRSIFPLGLTNSFWFQVFLQRLSASSSLILQLRHSASALAPLMRIFVTSFLRSIIRLSDFFIPMTKILRGRHCSVIVTPSTKGLRYRYPLRGLYFFLAPSRGLFFPLQISRYISLRFMSFWSASTRLVGWRSTYSGGKLYSFPGCCFRPPWFV
jgi:hypothetical protein